MKKLISTLLTIIFLQSQVFSFSIQPISLSPVNKSVFNNSIFGYQNSQSSNFMSLSHCEPEVKQSSLCCCYRFQSSAFVGAVDYEITQTKHEEVGGLFDMIDISNMKMDITGGGISLSTSYKESKDKERITSQKAVSNVIQSGNNIILETSKDLISQASQIVSDGNIDMTTGNNLILTFAEEIVSRTKEHSETTITVGVKIGNSYIDVGLAAKNLVNSTQNLNKAKDEYNEMQKKYDNGEISKTALEDAKVNLEVATLNVANATIAIATSINGAATSASSSLGTGLYGSAFTNYDTTTTESKEKTVTQNFGLISSNKDIRLKSGTNLVQEATDITAKETLSYDVGKELSILAGKTTGEQESKREHKTAGISYGNNAMQVSGSYGQDSSKAKTTSYTNSQSVAKDIIIKAQNTNISGANIQATNNLEVDIKNNLLLESKQDNYYLKGNGFNVGGSIGIGVNRNGSSSGGANYGNNKSNSDVNWVNQQTSLTGANSVNILVGNKTDIKGAVIANADVGYDSDGKIAFSNDKGNLTINTKELEYSDIKDKKVSESNGFNVGLTVGAGTDKQTATKYPRGSINIGATASGQEKEQTTKATIGNGKIIVDGQDYFSVIPADSSSSVIPAEQLGGNLSEINTTQSLSKLNRDISTTQELTKSQTTRALNINTTIDLRLLTKEGRKDILTALKNAPKNTKKATKNLIKDIKTTVAKTEEIIKQTITKQTKDELTKNVDKIEFSKNKQENKKVKDKILQNEELAKLQTAIDNIKILEEYLKNNSLDNQTIEKLKELGATGEYSYVIGSSGELLVCGYKYESEVIDGNNIQMTLTTIEALDERYLSQESKGTYKEILSNTISDATTSIQIAVGSSKEIQKIGKDTNEVIEDTKELIKEIAKSSQDKKTYEIAKETIKKIPNSIKETYYATVNVSNIENLQALGYNIGSKIYEYKENPISLLEDTASILTSYDLYKTGLTEENIIYATGLIVGGLAIDVAGTPLKAGKTITTTAKEIKVAEKVIDTTKGVKNFVGNYDGIREVSSYLKKERLSREQRLAVLSTFDKGTIYLDYANNNTYGLRFYDGINAYPKGRFLFETFTTQTNRMNLSLPYEWNLMSNIKQFQVKSGTPIIKGKAKSQIEYGKQYTGGANQWYVLDKENLLDIE